jgi:hypothetical protein
MINFSFWQRWLIAVGIGVSVFGILMAISSGTPLFDLFNRQIDPAFWSTNAVDGAAKQFQHWIYGVWGATIAGWGIFLTFVAHFAFNKREKWAWNCMVVGLLVWFILDTSLSLNHKVYFNAIFNTALIIFAGLPLIFTRRDFDIKIGKNE